jgi:hypothetical protein
MPTEETRTEYDRLSDGSGRWLWRCMVGTRVWRAGVEHRLDDARRIADVAWESYLDKAQTAMLLEAQRHTESPILDLDALERGPGGDDDAA